MPLRSLMEKLDVEDKTFVWVKRQLDWDVGQKIVALNIKASTTARNTSASIPKESAAHIVGFTNVEDHGQEGMELAFDKELAGSGWLASCDQGSSGPRGGRRGR
jgi:cell division protein FtsI (penicillin-binding protein 3)